MRRDTIAPLEALQEESVKASNIGSIDSRATEIASISATLTANDDFGSDEEELEIEMAQKVLTLGRQKSRDGKYAQSEAMLRKALQKSQSLGSKSADLNTKDITMDVAIVCFKQDKFDDTQQICERLIDERHRVGRKRSTALIRYFIRRVVLVLWLHDVVLDLRDPAYVDSLEC